jgi:NAD(P)-dependent dehydrogenase (short-subunit alcohol dehydrogenase family)
MELAERLKGTKITTNSLHPGVVTTKLLMQGFNTTGVSVEKGSENSIFVATSAELKGVTGKYFVDKKIVNASAAAQNLENAKKLWNVSMKLTQLAL